MATTAYVTKLPTCNFCSEQGTERPAEYDAKTVFGPWANMCTEHFLLRAASQELGTGRGQKLVVGEPPADDRQARFNEAMERGDYEAMEDAVGDGDPADFF